MNWLVGQKTLADDTKVTHNSIVLSSQEPETNILQEIPSTEDKSGSERETEREREVPSSFPMFLFTFPIFYLFLFFFFFLGSFLNMESNSSNSSQASKDTKLLHSFFPLHNLQQYMELENN